VRIEKCVIHKEGIMPHQ